MFDLTINQRIYNVETIEDIYTLLNCNRSRIYTYNDRLRIYFKCKDTNTILGTMYNTEYKDLHNRSCSSIKRIPTNEQKDIINVLFKQCIIMQDEVIEGNRDTSILTTFHLVDYLSKYPHLL